MTETNIFTSEKIKNMSNEELVLSVFSLMKEAEKRKPELLNKLSECDKQKEDILHRMEYPYHGSVGARFMKELKRIQCERRTVKNDLENIDYITKSFKVDSALRSYKNRKEKKYTFRTSVLEKITGDKKGNVLCAEEKNND